MFFRNKFQCQIVEPHYIDNTVLIGVDSFLLKCLTTFKNSAVISFWEEICKSKISI